VPPAARAEAATRQTEAVPSRTARYQSARRDPSQVVLEGFHALKHALRFGATVSEAATPDPAAILTLASSLAPDLLPILPALLEEVSAEEFAGMAPAAPPTPVLALAGRPQADAAALLAAPGPAPLVFLDRPSHLGNLGAVVRVAAAAEAAGVVTTGERDPWHSLAVRASAGLHFALPVARLAGPLPAGRPLVALVPEGDSLWEATLPPGPVLAFGGERRGLGPDLIAAASRRLAIPMAPRVSSLNLATAAAVVLFEARRRRDGRPGAAAGEEQRPPGGT
jgi:RNA methyltransferase, TrmH family